MAGIEHIALALNPNAAATAEACYDLGGRAIQQPQKGQVYMKGGKKHVEENPSFPKHETQPAPEGTPP